MLTQEENNFNKVKTIELYKQVRIAYLTCMNGSLRKLSRQCRRSRHVQIFAYYKETYVLLNRTQFLLVTKINIIFVKLQENHNAFQSHLEHLEFFSSLIWKTLTKRVLHKIKKKRGQITWLKKLHNEKNNIVRKVHTIQQNVDSSAFRFR